MVGTRLLAVLGIALIGGAVANEVTNVPVTLSQYTLMAIVGFGGLCVAAFLVLAEFERWGRDVPGPLIEQEERDQAEAPGQQHEAGVEPGLARERQGQPEHQDDRPDEAEPAGGVEHATG